MRKISLFIATSLDGNIAKPNDDLSFLNSLKRREKTMVMRNLQAQLIH